MKKTLIVAALAVGLSTAAYSQGTVFLRNDSNTDTSSTATSNGLLFTTSPTGVVSLEQGNVSITMLGGASATSLTPIVTILGSANGGDGDGGGQFTDFSANAIYTIPGVSAGTPAFIDLEIWEGSATTFAAAQQSGANVDGNGILFSNPTGGGTTPTTYLTGMPAIVLAVTPEPSTIILGGLGAAALLAFRRRK